MYPIPTQAENEQGILEEIRVSHGISAIVLLNLQSYGGGRDLWGLSNAEADHHTKKTFKDPIFNDELFEVGGVVVMVYSGARSMCVIVLTVYVVDCICIVPLCMYRSL